MTLQMLSPHIYFGVVAQVPFRAVFMTTSLVKLMKTYAKTTSILPKKLSTRSESSQITQRLDQVVQVVSSKYFCLETVQVKVVVPVR